MPGRSGPRRIAKRPAVARAAPAARPRIPRRGDRRGATAGGCSSPPNAPSAAASTTRLRSMPMARPRYALLFFRPDPARARAAAAEPFPLLDERDEPPDERDEPPLEP